MLILLLSMGLFVQKMAIFCILDPEMLDFGHFLRPKTCCITYFCLLQLANLMEIYTFLAFFERKLLYDIEKHNTFAASNRKTTLTMPVETKECCLRKI